MANPTQDLLSNAEAVALDDVVHGPTGARFMPKGVNDTSNPDVFARFIAAQKHALDLIGQLGGGVIDKGGLNVGVFAMSYAIAGVSKSYAGDATFLLAASVTNFLYLDAAATLKVDVAAWPSVDHVRLATVITNGTTVTAIADARWENFQVGFANRWSGVKAQDPVDMDGFSLGKIGEVWSKASSELTIAAGAITPTSSIHTVDTEADAAADDLITLTADAAKIGRIVILQAEDQSRVVTIKSQAGGNIVMNGGQFVMTFQQQLIGFLQHNATQWIELFRNMKGAGPGVIEDLSFAGGFDLTNLSKLRFLETPVTVDGETIDATGSLMMVEGSVSETLLSIITGGEAGQILILKGGDTWPLTVGGTGNIVLSNGADLKLSLTTSITLMENAGFWIEIGRTVRMEHLVGSGQVIPFSPGTCFYAGALSDGQKTFNAITVQPFKLTRAHGYVNGVPVTDPCVVRVMKNGVSVFTPDSSAIQIAAGANSGVSAVGDIDFNAGDWLSVEVADANSATDLTVTFDGYAQPANP